MASPAYLPRESFGALFEALRAEGYHCVGPLERDGAIVYERIDSVDQLPHGVRDRQSPGAYRLEASDEGRYFAWANGPQALKPRVFAPREVVWRAHRDTDDGSLRFESPAPEAEPLAVLGVRACDLAALGLQDRHFLEGGSPDPSYTARRGQLFLIAVHCTHPAQTCFCASTGDGPRAEAGYDMALSELDEGFLVEAASARGEAVMQRLPLGAATGEQRRRAADEIDAAARAQQRALPSRDLRAPLFANLEHPRWQEVAARCLSCGNCTSVCPTCFCSNQEESGGLELATSEHVREWDSCFSAQHSYIHGIVIRTDTRARYRQWLTHKLGGWHDQFGRSGCVGCGRCITWCPVGIDITEEAAAIAGGEGA